MICKNCKRLLPQQINYCNGCGAKVIKNRLTMRNLFEDFAYRFLNYDNLFLQTIIALLKTPEKVINSYVEGARKTYVDPISFFAINLTLSGLYILIIRKYFNDVMNFATLSGSQSEAQVKLQESITVIFYDYGSLVNSIIIPILALISIIIFYNKKYNYTEHIIVYLYSMSLFSILSMVTGLIVLSIDTSYFMPLSLLQYLLLFIYHAVLFKRLFNLSIKQLFLKILIFIPLSFLFYIGISVAMVLLFLVFSDIPLKDFAPKN